MAHTLLENKLIISLVFANKAITSNLGHAAAVLRTLAPIATAHL